MAAQRKYPDELRDRAVKMLFEVRDREGKGHGELARVARQIQAPGRPGSRAGSQHTTPERRHPRGRQPIRAARLECQTVGVEWPTVTRPADRTNDQIIPAASRSCVCGHQVYDDQESRCALCACRDHRLRSSAAREQGSPFPAWHRGQAGAS